MPVNVVKSKADEKKWGRAKRIAAKQKGKGSKSLAGDDFRLVMHIYQSMKKNDIADMIRQADEEFKKAIEDDFELGAPSARDPADFELGEPKAAPIAAAPAPSKKSPPAAQSHPDLKPHYDKHRAAGHTHSEAMHLSGQGERLSAQQAFNRRFNFDEPISAAMVEKLKPIARAHAAAHQKQREQSAEFEKQPMMALGRHAGNLNEMLSPVVDQAADRVSKLPKHANEYEHWKNMLGATVDAHNDALKAGLGEHIGAHVKATGDLAHLADQTIKGNIAGAFSQIAQPGTAEASDIGEAGLTEYPSMHQQAMELEGTPERSAAVGAQQLGQEYDEDAPGGGVPTFQTAAARAARNPKIAEAAQKELTMRGAPPSEKEIQDIHDAVHGIDEIAGKRLLHAHAALKANGYELRKKPAPTAQDPSSKALHEHFIQQHLPLVNMELRRIMSGWSPEHRQAVDEGGVISAGQAALTNQLNTYKHSPDRPFHAYAKPAVRGAILQELAQQSEHGALPPSVKQTVSRMQRESEAEEAKSKAGEVKQIDPSAYAAEQGGTTTDPKELFGEHGIEAPEEQAGEQAEEAPSLEDILAEKKDEE